MSSSYSRQECIEAIEQAAEELCKSPTKKEFNETDISPSASTIVRIFGTWNKAKQQASVDKYSREKYTKSDCVDAIHTAYEELGKSPTYKEYQDLDILPAASTIKRIFGSWNEAKKASETKEYPQTYYSIDDVPDRLSFTQHEWEEMTANRRQVWRKRVYAEKIKLKRGCFNCGYDEYATPLSFHHENTEEKENSISWLVNNGKSYQRIDNEIKKCKVLCANCHMVEEHGR